MRSRSLRLACFLFLGGFTALWLATSHVNAQVPSSFCIQLQTQKSLPANAKATLMAWSGTQQDSSTNRLLYSNTQVAVSQQRITVMDAAFLSSIAGMSQVHVYVHVPGYRATRATVTTPFSTCATVQPPFGAFTTPASIGIADVLAVIRHYRGETVPEVAAAISEPIVFSDIVAVIRNVQSPRVDVPVFQPVSSSSAKASSSAKSSAASSVAAGPRSFPTANFLVRSIRDGSFENAAIWNVGRVPSRSDNVIVEHNVIVNSGEVGMLAIEAGTLTLAGALDAYGSVVVDQKGTLAGTTGKLRFHVADDRAMIGNTQPGPHPEIHAEFFPTTDIGLWVLGTVNLKGQIVTPRVNAVAQGAKEDSGTPGVSRALAFDSASATLASAPTGWKAGDKLWLVNEKGNDTTATITAINGTTLIYQAADTTFQAHVLYRKDTNAVLFTPFIANMTRGITITSADVKEGDFNHRAHVAVMPGGNAWFEHVAFENLGPRAKLGRYPIHYHMMNDLDTQKNAVIGSSVYQTVSEPGSRLIAIHNTHGLTVRDNVMKDSFGHGVFMETGIEHSNHLINNVAGNVIGTPGTPSSGPKDELNVKQKESLITHAYWVNADNEFANNIAVGGNSPELYGRAFGFIMLPNTLNKAVKGVVNGFTALGVGKFGAWTAQPGTTFNDYAAFYGIGSGYANWPPSFGVGMGGATLNDPVLVGNGVSADEKAVETLSQIYISTNVQPHFQVNRGFLAGNTIIHNHYGGTAIFKDTVMNAKELMDPTYFEFAITMENVRMVVDTLFGSIYPIRRNSPGFLTLKNADVTEKGQRTASLTAAYSKPDFKAPLTDSTTLNYSGRSILRFNSAIPASGFLRVSSVTLPRTGRYWKVIPTGQPMPTKPSFIPQSLEVWDATLTLFGGYPEGFAPGTYDVIVCTDDQCANVVLEKTGVVVKSGEITDI